jgi:MFS transporter, YQGE family, putative transporter
MHHHHEFWWKFVPKKELTQVYTSLTLRSLALSLLGIFLPLYLYQEIGFSLQQTFNFYISFSLLLGISSPLAAKFCSRFGIKHSVLFSIPIYIVFLVLLYFLPVMKTSLILLGAIVGVSTSFYWIAMHQLFYHASNSKHRGEEFGKRRALRTAATFFGPLIGGILIMYIGFKVVFVTSSVILIISAFVLFCSKEKHSRYNFSFRSVVNKDHWKDSLYFISEGVELIATGVIWPLFIFTILGDYFSLGVVGAILAGLTAVLVWIFGKYSDHIGSRKIIRWVSGFEAASWIVKAFVITTAHVFGATIFGALTKGTILSPLGRLKYNKAKDNVAAYFVSREVFLSFGRILMLMFVLMTNSFTDGLIFQGVASLAALLF